MNFYNSQIELTSEVDRRLSGLHSPISGAYFRAAFSRRDDALLFLTGLATFRQQGQAAREIVDYRTLVLVEEWVPGLGQAVGRLRGLLEGTGEIAGKPVPNAFTRASGAHEPLALPQRWPGWQYMSRIDEQLGKVRENLNLAQAPLIFPNLRPYVSPASAITEFIFETPPTSRMVYESPHLGEFVTFISDTSARITSAHWLPGIVRFEVELAIPESDVQVQLLHVGAGADFQIIPARTGAIELEVPGGAETLSIFLVHRDGLLITYLDLKAEYDAFGTAASAAKPVWQAIADLSGGETDEVEYKPWITPKDKNKENEVVETVVAFSNTRGGRIYIGTDDNGFPAGEKRLRAVFEGNMEQAIEKQIERIRELIREKTKPVPSFDVQRIDAHGHPLVVIEIKMGTRRPYATDDNTVLIRKGATNRRPDPQTEFPG